MPNEKVVEVSVCVTVTVTGEPGARSVALALTFCSFAAYASISCSAVIQSRIGSGYPASGTPIAGRIRPVRTSCFTTVSSSRPTIWIRMVPGMPVSMSVGVQVTVLPSTVYCSATYAMSSPRRWSSSSICAPGCSAVISDASSVIVRAPFSPRIPTMMGFL